MDANPQGALAAAISEFVQAMSRRVRQHDRFVVIGLILSALPLPPACFIGLLITLLNMGLLLAGRLARIELAPIALAIVLGALNCAASSYVIWLIWSQGDPVGAIKKLAYLPDAIKSHLLSLIYFIRWLLEALHGRPAGIPVRDVTF